MADRVGQQLGNYGLTRLLGEGGFAEVYLGEHIHLGTQAAIKVLHTQLTSDDVDKFRTEARTIARLIHPHIVRVLEFGVEGKTPFLVMDYAPNGTLRQRHPRGTRLPLDVVVDYVKQIADALQYAHDERVVHRDVKPENMLVGRRNVLLLSDFGIALVAQSSRYQSALEMAGTMAYMAPEQIQGKPRPASDQYSLGVVVYEWLTGDRPFHGSLTELVGQHLSVPPPSLQEKLPKLPSTVEEVVLTALAKDPKERFGSVQAFATALEQTNKSLSDLTTPNSKIIKSSQPLLLTQPMAGSSPKQSYQSTRVTVPSRVPASNKSSSRVRIKALLILGLALFVAVSSIGFFYFTRTVQRTSAGTSATATIQSHFNATATSEAINQANNDATATAQNNPTAIAFQQLQQKQNLYTQLTSNSPVFNDPLHDNSKGTWDERSDTQGGCTFTGGTYHAYTGLANSKEAVLCNSTFSYRGRIDSNSKYVFQVQMTIVKGGAGGFFGSLSIDANGYYNFGSCPFISIFSSPCTQGYASTFHRGLGQTNQITIVQINNEIDLFVNAQYIDVVTNFSTYSANLPSLLAIAQPGQSTDVVYSDAKLWII